MEDKQKKTKSATKKITFKETVPLAPKNEGKDEAITEVVPPPITLNKPLQNHPEVAVNREVIDKFTTQVANKMTTELTDAQKKGATLKVAQMVEKLETSDEEAAEILKKILEYHKKYRGILRFNWIEEKSLGKLSPNDLKLYLNQLQTAKNTQGAPETLKKGLGALADFLENLIGIATENNRMKNYVNLKHFAEAVKENAENGYFDDEIDQIIIEHAGWFARGPKARLAMKMGGIAFNINEANRNGISIANQKNTLSKKWTEDL